MLLEFKELVKKYNLNIKGVIQIGAHYGEEDGLYTESNIDNVIYFEPIKSNFLMLERSVPKNRILYNYALGNENTSIEMYVESENKGQSCSILKPQLHTQQYPKIVFNNKEIVEMKRLDEIDFDKKKFNLINIDVQGYELEVFKGSVKTLENIDYIISEINRDFLYEKNALVNELENFLSDFGFELVETNWAGNTWGDGFFIKKHLK